MPDKKLTDSEKIAKWQKEKLGDKNYNEIQEKAKHDNEIVKAFRCCYLNEALCEECPCFKDEKCTDMEDVYNIPKQIIDLINRQNEEKKVMQAYIDCLRAEIENLKDILYDAEGVNLVNYWHQQCKIAENGNRNFDEENKRLKAEIERLDKELEVEKNQVIRLENQVGRLLSMNQVKLDTIHDLQEENNWYSETLNTTKAEAYKGFAEKLKEKSWDVPYETKNAHFVQVVDVGDIDNLLKELERNGEHNL